MHAKSRTTTIADTCNNICWCTWFDCWRLVSFASWAAEATILCFCYCFFYDMTPIAERVCVCVHYFSRFCLLSAMLMMLSRVVNCIINVCWGRRHIKTKLLICNKSWQVVKLLTYIYNCINTKVHKRKSVCGTKPKDTKEDSYVYLGVWNGSTSIYTKIYKCL